MAQSKIGIAASGGGMSCVYGAGTLLALGEVHGLREPLVAVGSSGSTGSLAYYVAQQYEAGRRIWCELLSTKEFIDMTRLSNILNIDYLIDEVFRKQEPLDVAAVQNSPTHLFIAATDYETGEVLYYDSKRDEDIFNALRGSKAAPIAFRGQAHFQGKRILDGELSSSLEKNIEKAFAEGAEKVIAIDTRNPINAVTRRLLQRYAEQVSPGLRQTIHHYIHSPRQLNPDPRVLYLSPQQQLLVGMLDNKREHLRAAFEQGYAETKVHAQLAAFLQ